MRGEEEGIGLCIVGTVHVKNTQIYFLLETWCSMMCSK